MKKFLSALMCLVLVFASASCAKSEPDSDLEISGGVFSESAPALLGAGSGMDVIQDEKYDAVYVGITIEDFLASGFCFGDSVDVSFSNGYELLDIPFYNGYYVRTGDPLVVGYPGYPYVAITLNNEGLWTKAGLTGSESVTISLNEADKYLATQEALSQDYSNDRGDYESDEQFANFRPLSGGTLKEDFLYRGATPCSSEKNRAEYADALIGKKGVRFVLDLADTEENFEAYIAMDSFKSDYTASLYSDGCIALLGMSSNYGSDTYKGKLAEGLKKMTGSEGPVYIHCTEGKDRTGFVCMLLEALAGAGYDEMRSDYMKTYENYYGVTREKMPEKYDAIVDLYFDAFMSYLAGTEDIETLRNADYTEYAFNYLRSAGMTDGEIESLVSMITK